MITFGAFYFVLTIVFGIGWLIMLFGIRMYMKTLDDVKWQPIGTVGAILICVSAILYFFVMLVQNPTVPEHRQAISQFHEYISSFW